MNMRVAALSRRPGDIAFEHFAYEIDRSPGVHHLAVYPDVHLVPVISAGDSPYSQEALALKRLLQ